MAWSYDPEQVATNPVYQVRLIIGDTVETPTSLQDEEIEFMLGDPPNVARASVLAIQALISRISTLPEYKLGPYSEDHSSRLAYLRALLEDIKAQNIGLNAPDVEKPTTCPIFSYDMMSPFCWHPKGGSGC